MILEIVIVICVSIIILALIIGIFYLCDTYLYSYKAAREELRRMQQQINTMYALIREFNVTSDD